MPEFFSRLIMSSSSFALVKSAGWKVPGKGKGSSHVVAATVQEISLTNQSAPDNTALLHISGAALVLRGSHFTMQG